MLQQSPKMMLTLLRSLRRKMLKKKMEGTYIHGIPIPSCLLFCYFCFSFSAYMLQQSPKICFVDIYKGSVTAKVSSNHTNDIINFIVNGTVIGDCTLNDRSALLRKPEFKEQYSISVTPSRQCVFTIYDFNGTQIPVVITWTSGLVEASIEGKPYSRCTNGPKLVFTLREKEIQTDNCDGCDGWMAVSIVLLVTVIVIAIVYVWTKVKRTPAPRHSDSRDDQAGAGQELVQANGNQMTNGEANVFDGINRRKDQGLQRRTGACLRYLADRFDPDPQS